MKIIKKAKILIRMKIKKKWRGVYISIEKEKTTGKMQNRSSEMSQKSILELLVIK